MMETGSVDLLLLVFQRANSACQKRMQRSQQCTPSVIFLLCVWGKGGKEVATF